MLCRGWSRQGAARRDGTRSKEKPRITTGLGGLSPAGERIRMIGLFLTVTGRYAIIINQLYAHKTTLI